jgi:hypothetical protein
MERRITAQGVLDVALQGTIDSFPVVDVLRLLSSSGKTGRLELVGDRGRAALWVAEGDLVAGAAQGKPCGDPAQSLWELLRYSDGSFEFHDGDLPTGPGFEPTPVDQMIERAVRMQAEWEQIERRVPSMSHRVELAAVLPGAEVRLSAEDWAIVVAAGRGLSVASLIEQVGLEEFEGCRRLAEMVDRGLLGTEVTTVPTAVPPGPAPASQEVRMPQEVRAAADTALPGPAQGAADAFAAAGEQGMPGSEPVAVALDLEAGAQQPASVVSASAVQPTSQGTDTGGFPEHFPIDDLVADPEPSWEQAPSDAGSVGSVGSPAAVTPPPEPAFAPETAFAPEPGAAPVGGLDHDPGWGQAMAPQGPPAATAGNPDVGWPAETAPAAPVQPAPPPQVEAPPEDDVLAQIGRLSPKAAEAIAAALGDGVERGPAG